MLEAWKIICLQEWHGAYTRRVEDCAGTYTRISESSTSADGCRCLLVKSRTLVEICFHCLWLFYRVLGAQLMFSYWYWMAWLCLASILMVDQIWWKTILCVYIYILIWCLGDCIDCKCLTECQSRLGMVGPSLGVSFWFISLVIMSLMNSGSYNKFWAVTRILGLKTALNPMDYGTGLLEIVPGCRHVGLSECLDLFGH